jgi:hypothetical protein
MAHIFSLSNVGDNARLKLNVSYVLTQYTKLHHLVVYSSDPEMYLLFSHRIPRGIIVNYWLGCWWGDNDDELK